MADYVEMSAFAGPTEFEQEKPYLSDSPVFRLALERQAELDKHQFLTVEAALAAGNAVCAELDSLAEAAGLMGAAATLKGPETIVPILTMDPLNETTYLGVRKLTGDIWNPVDPTGVFIGFGTAPKGEYKEVESDGSIIGIPDLKLASVKARLQYMVMDRGTVSALTVLSGRLCAHAPVDTSTVEFAKDTRRREAARALGIISELDLPDAQFFAHNLNATVKSGERRHSRLRSLGHMVRHFVERNYDDLSEMHKDAILDFLKARLRLDSGDLIQVETDTASLEPGTSPGGMLSNISLAGELNDLAFSPHMFHGAMAKDIPGEHAVRLNVRSKRATTPALVVPWDTLDPSNSTFLHIPLEKIRKLK